MSRGIKVRAWDKKDKRIADVLLIDWLNKLVDLDHGVIEREFDEVELIEYTGLKDKNGKEIYEGDIVHAMSQGVAAKGEVKRRIDGLWLMYPAWQSGKTWVLAPDRHGDTTVEVIGNIYENSELLKG